jgi:SAM-dependent methyltransferase
MTGVCNVCGAQFAAPIFESIDDSSITTMNKVIAGRTRVFFCDGCGHLQTTELSNLREYYAFEYAINTASEDDDQLYRVVDGKPVFRADHQAAVLAEKVAFFPGCRVLDYGCAKAPTLRKLMARHLDIEPYLFDVTDRYVPFWQRYPKPPRWAAHELDPSWYGTLDVVLSFYALEHVADLGTALGNVRSLLKAGGIFYFIVPNVYRNTADFIVADHINHFSASSLERMLLRAGFIDVAVDAEAHDAAFVVTARLGTGQEASTPSCAVSADDRAQALAMADYWRHISARIRAFEDGLPAGAAAAVYGAGFYGSFVGSSLRDVGRVRCFVDQNPHLHGTTLLDRPVLAPAQLPPDVGHVLVGLNPRTARESIAAVEAWRGRFLDYFFL